MTANGSRRDAKLILALAEGKTIEDAAEHSGMSQSTAYRRLRDDAFRARISEVQVRLFREALEHLSGVSMRAARRLGDLIDEIDGKTALAACKAILEAAGRHREFLDAAEIKRRLDEIDSRLPPPTKGR